MLKNKLKNKIILFFNLLNKSILIFKVKYFLVLIGYIYCYLYNFNKYTHLIVSETLHENNLDFNLFRKTYLQYKGKEFLYNDE